MPAAAWRWKPSALKGFLAQQLGLTEAPLWKKTLLRPFLPFAEGTFPGLCGQSCRRDGKGSAREKEGGEQKKEPQSRCPGLEAHWTEGLSR